jgi:hypothetical protein
MVPKDYVFAANFAQQFRYNEQALVYSGLLARNTAFSGGNGGLASERARLSFFRKAWLSSLHLSLHAARQWPVWAQPQVKV